MQVKEQFTLQTEAGNNIDVLCFGEVAYEESHAAMMAYANERDENSLDQIWLLQHPAVYTQGTACDAGTFLPSDIPVVKTDRGGQITYHGPGQIVMYPLLHLKRHKLGVKALVTALEQCVIDLLAEFSLSGERRDDAPGVYINDAKIAALGLRIRKGNSYHGLSMNVDMDLSPFNNINPCGYQGLKVAQLSQFSLQLAPLETGKMLAKRFAQLI